MVEYIGVVPDWLPRTTQAHAHFNSWRTHELRCGSVRNNMVESIVMMGLTQGKESTSHHRQEATQLESSGAVLYNKRASELIGVLWEHPLNFFQGRCFHASQHLHNGDAASGA